MQVPPCWHGWEKHSLISSEQLVPTKPGEHCDAKMEEEEEEEEKEEEELNRWRT